jgi:hypothetical protein
MPSGMPCADLAPAVPRPQRFVITFPLRSGRSAVRTNALVPAPNLSYLPFRLFTKRNTVVASVYRANFCTRDTGNRLV